VITTYLLSLAVFIPVSGWIADRFWRAPRVLRGGLDFCRRVGAVRLANSLPMLIAMRIVQGSAGR